MGSDDTFASDDAFIDSLYNEAMDADVVVPSGRYTHAFVEARLLDVLKAIRTRLDDDFQFECDVFGISKTLANVRSYLAERGCGTIIWLPQKSLRLVAAISRRLHAALHWVSVYESFACRAYLQFVSGRCTSQVLDPARYWTENILEGDDILGSGMRRFPNHAAFRDSIVAKYEPIDDIWDFEMVDDAVKRRDAALICALGPVVEVNVTDNVASGECIGDWPVKDQELTENVLSDIAQH